MGFFAVIFALILGLIIGFAVGIGSAVYTIVSSSDEDFEKRINSFREDRIKYKESHKE